MENIESKIKAYIENERANLSQEVSEIGERIKHYIISDLRLSSLKKQARLFYDENAVNHEVFTVINVRHGMLYALASYLHEKSDFQRFVDAGCGCGIETCCLSMLFPEKQFIGYDLSPNMIHLAEKRKEKLGLKNLTLMPGDHDTIHLEDIDILYNNSSLIEEQHFMSRENKNTIKKLNELKSKRFWNLRQMLDYNGIYAFQVFLPSLKNSPAYGTSKLLEKAINNRYGEWYLNHGFLLSSCVEISTDESMTHLLVLMKKWLIEGVDF